MILKKILDRANEEVGYLEKKSNNMLEDKILNVGNSNFTKYANELDKIDYFNGDKNGYPWCATFINWLFYKEVGKSIALKMLLQPSKNSSGAGCSEAMTYFKRGKCFYKEPMVGDQIFFTKDNGKTSHHTGLVVEVDSEKIYTIEGNTSNRSEVVDNGGAVCKKSYRKNNTYIAGYGRPKWELVETIEVKEEDQVVEEKEFIVNGNSVNIKSILKDGRNYVDIREVCKVLGAKVGYDNDTKKVEITSFETTKIKINGVVKEIKRILINGENLVRLRDLADDKIVVGYVKEENLPTVDIKQ